MPIPSTKIFLNSALASGGAVRFTPNALGDFVPFGLTAPVAPWLGATFDLNGDGRNDLIFGAAADDDKAVDAGRVFIEMAPLLGGSTVGIGDSVTQIIIDGISAGDHAGAAVGGIADLNNDGRGEILIGAPGVDIAGMSDAGTGYVVFGKASGGVDLADIQAGSGGYAINGEAAGDAAGTTIAAISDLNGDGKADILIGAIGNDAGGTDAGAVYVTWGKSTTSAVNLASVAAGTGGFKIISHDGGSLVGSVIGSTSDMTGDGKAEILIGSPEAGNKGAHTGAVYVVFGKSTGTAVSLDSIAAGLGGFVINGVDGDNAGSAVTGIGDVNGDGRGDILIGASRSDHAYVVFGKADGTAVSLADVRNGIGGFQILAEHAGDLDKLSITGGVDLNRDGIADLVIGTPSNNEGGSNAGAVYVVWGGGSSTVDLALIAQSMGGAKIVGTAGSLTGSSVVIAGNLAGDAAPDLLIGASGVGESAYLLTNPTSWQPDTNVYGTNVADTIGVGYGSTHLVGEGADNILGLGGNDTIFAAGGDDTIDGGTGADAMSGGTGNDTYYVDNTLDTVIENAGEGTDTVIASVNFTLGANVENLTMAAGATLGTGNAQDNTITGNAAANTLDGLAGADTMIGGLGNDTYKVDNLGDVVTELAGEGTDTVISTLAAYTLGANVENLTLGTGAIAGTGNGLANAITGNAQANTLDGGTGADTMTGLGGNDTYIVDSLGDVVVEAVGGGTDTVVANVNGLTLAANVENLTLGAGVLSGTGNAGDNTLTGNALANSLDGGAGADLMAGGLGDDTYFVDNAGDVASEVAGEGTDTIVASIDYTLTAGTSIENLTLAGTAHSATGNSGNNVITGGGGNDILDGGGGIDTLVGGAGDDTYRVDTTTDTITENAGGGTDTVVSSVDFSLAALANVENLTLTGAATHGTGNALDNVMTGGPGGVVLDGGAGNDTMIGGTGADTLIGGDGNDTYIVDNTGDTIVETATGGIDTVVVSTDWTLADNIENVTLTGTGHALTGNAGDNTLKGDVGDDTLDGGAGNDTEQGGDGNDTLISTSGHDVLVGGAGDDTYKIHGGSAHIEDFQGHDTIDASEAAGDSHIDLSGETQSEIEHQICDFGTGGTVTGALNVQFLQDLTGSFADDIANVRVLVPEIAAALQTVSGGAAFGASSFRDKAFGAFGGIGDYVYQTNLGMGATQSALISTYTGFVATGGSDLPEAQLEALMQLALRPTEVGFQANAARFVVLFTDASFHTAADGRAAGILTPNNGNAIIDDGGILENYPELAQVRAALEAANVIPIFAIAGGFEAEYQGLATALGRGTVVTLAANSANIVSAITTGLATATTTHIADAIGGAGNDTIVGNTAANTLTGNGGNDTLTGGLGNDVLHGGTGSDTAVYTGASTDYTVVHNADGTVTVTDLRATGNEGTDTLDGIEFLSFSDGIQPIDGGTPPTPPVAAADSLTGIVEAGTGVAGNATGSGNVLTNDTITGAPGTVTAAGAGAGTLGAVSGATVIAGQYGSLTIAPDGSYSYTLDNALPATEALATGDAVSDVFTYRVTDAAGLTAEAQITVSIAGSTDLPPTVVTTAADALLVTRGQPSALDAAVLLGNDTATNGESLTVTSVTNATGGTVDLVAGKLVVNATGAGGFDYVATSTTGATATGHATFATVTSTLLADKLTVGPGIVAGDLVGSDGNDILTGGAGNDRLDGGNGNDTLNGGAGADTMIGGTGTDAYFVDNAGDLVIEAAGGGVDTVTTTLAAYTLTAEVENLKSSGAGDFTLTGNGLANAITGGNGNDSLYGLDGNDSLVGGAGNDLLDGGIGNDTLNGGIGADTMIGGAGTDAYFVDNAGDVVIEAAGGGTDTVTTTLLAYTLTAEVENLKSSGTGDFVLTGNGLANTITGGNGNDSLFGLDGNDMLIGGAGNDVLDGGNGNDTLNGGIGADTMSGGAGTDAYTVDNVGDLVIEAAGGGVDTVTTTLLAYTLTAEVENLKSSGAGDFSLTGNGLANAITGGAGNDTLFGLAGTDTLIGGAGNDRLVGGAGADTLTGGAGADSFVFDTLGTSADKDTIKDFTVGADHLVIDRSVFTAFAADLPGALDQAEFTLGASATTASQHLIYNSATGALFYDADGVGGAAQVQIALLSTHPVLGAGDFLLI